MVGRQNAILDCLTSINREIAVQLEHGVVRLDGVVGVDLNLIVFLRDSTGRNNENQSAKN